MSNRISVRRLFIGALALVIMAAAVPPAPLSAQAKAKAPAVKDTDPYAGLALGAFRLRSIGPALTSGRIADFAVRPGKRHEFFVATASGGAWKTVNAGTGLHRNFRFQPHWIAILILLTLMPVLNSCGESQPEKKLPSFQHFTQKEGLSSEMVYAITVQGKEVWFGTYGGGATLYNKENKTWKAYTTKGEPMEQMDDGDSIKWKNLLSYNHVSAILPDKDRIWFGTYFYGFGGGGISYYSPQSSPQWKKFTTNNGRAKKVVSMASDGESLWIGSEKGLSLFDKKREGWKEFYSLQEGLSGNFVNALLLEQDFLWIGTNGGISRFQKEKKIWKTYSQKDGLTEVEITCRRADTARPRPGATGRPGRHGEHLRRPAASALERHLARIGRDHRRGT